MYLNDILQLPEIANIILKYLDYPSASNLLRVSNNVRKCVFQGIGWRRSVLERIFRRNLLSVIDVDDVSKIPLHNIYFDRLDAIINILFLYNLPFYYRDNKRINLGLTLDFLFFICKRIEISYRIIDKLVSGYIKGFKFQPSFKCIHYQKCPLIDYKGDPLEDFNIFTKYTNDWCYGAVNNTIIEIQNINNFLFIHLLFDKIVLNRNTSKIIRHNPFKFIPFDIKFMNKYRMKNPIDLFFNSVKKIKNTQNKYKIKRNVFVFNQGEKIFIHMNKDNNIILVSSKYIDKKIILNFNGGLINFK